MAETQVFDAVLRECAALPPDLRFFAVALTDDGRRYYWSASFTNSEIVSGHIDRVAAHVPEAHDG